MIDTHVHLVSSDEGRYPLRPTPLSGPWYRAAPCSAERFLQHMDEAGVARAVLVQPVGAYSHDCSYAADSAAAHPGRFAGVCSVDPDGPDPVGRLDHWVRERGMRGVRLLALSRGGPSWLADPRTFPLWERAARLGARVVVTVFFHQLAELGAVLRRFPEVPVALDHCGFPPFGGFASEREPLLALAEHANLHCKVSSVVLETAEKTGDPRGFVAELVSAFGAERVMWGSDFSQTHDRSYAALVELGRGAFGALPPEERASCLAGSAGRLWFPGARALEPTAGFEPATC